MRCLNQCVKMNGCVKIEEKLEKGFRRGSGRTEGEDEDANDD